ncbi:hypothetical protein CC2G_002931 [Coprinopsis cinerea AmutBmut pab1-1]|nr:hypothetical protein CC2G_002928 [Coprinopsis cinerea AmutBmut pab1-1]KAG2004370.1 hypothetical protein CC2G_002931 [Coprinopsis cinerea AmutBmut pab1-1]
MPPIRTQDNVEPAKNQTRGNRKPNIPRGNFEEVNARCQRAQEEGGKIKATIDSYLGHIRRAQGWLAPIVAEEKRRAMEWEMEKTQHCINEAPTTGRKSAMPEDMHLAFTDEPRECTPQAIRMSSISATKSTLPLYQSNTDKRQTIHRKPNQPSPSPPTVTVFNTQSLVIIPEIRGMGPDAWRQVVRDWDFPDPSRNHRRPLKELSKGDVPQKQRQLYHLRKVIAEEFINVYACDEARFLADYPSYVKGCTPLFNAIRKKYQEAGTVARRNRGPHVY